MTDIVRRAKEYATEKHRGQVRKGDNAKYITHPEEVYKIAKTFTNDESILAACWLHDTIEDTPVTYSDLVKNFNKEIADIVQAVSEDKEIESWHLRKNKYTKSVFSNEKAIIVAWADKMHNTVALKNANPLAFNVSIKEKIKFYKQFADLIPQKELKTRLKHILDTYTLPYIMKVKGKRKI